MWSGCPILCIIFGTTPAMTVQPAYSNSEHHYSEIFRCWQIWINHIGWWGAWVSDITRYMTTKAIFGSWEKNYCPTVMGIKKIFKPCYWLKKIIKLSNMLKKIFRLHWKYQAPPWKSTGCSLKVCLMLKYSDIYDLWEPIAIVIFNESLQLLHTSSR